MTSARRRTNGAIWSAADRGAMGEDPALATAASPPPAGRLALRPRVVLLDRDDSTEVFDRVHRFEMRVDVSWSGLVTAIGYANRWHLSCRVYTP